jgi:hypothetical protein
MSAREAAQLARKCITEITQRQSAQVTALGGRWFGGTRMGSQIIGQQIRRFDGQRNTTAGAFLGSVGVQLLHYFFSAPAMMRAHALKR